MGDRWQGVQDFLASVDVGYALDRDDRDAYEKEAKRDESMKSEALQFAASYSKYRADTRVAPKAAGRGRGAGMQGKRKGKGRGKAAPTRAVPAGVLTQPQLKRLLPPSAYIWRSNSSHAWASHRPPAKRFCATWDAHGERKAAILAVRSAWEYHSLFTGEPRESCDVAGLFDDDAETRLPAGLQE